MRAGEYYKVEVEYIRFSEASVKPNVLEWGVIGGRIGRKLFDKRREARLQDLLTLPGHWVRIRNPIDAVVFAQRWDEFENALELHEEVAHDLLEMDVEQFRAKWVDSEGDVQDQEPPPPANDPWQGVVWSERSDEG